jgi:hypothetical protein
VVLRHRHALARALVALLIAAGTLCAAGGTPLLYARTQILEPEQFGERVEQAVAAPEVQEWIARRLTDQGVEGDDAVIPTAKPLVQSLVQGEVSSNAFRSIAAGAGAAA